MHSRICSFVCITNVPHHAKGTHQEVDRSSSSGISTPWLMLEDMQGTETTVSAHSSPRLPSPTQSCHCLPCAPREKVCTHLHIPSALFHGRLIPLATDSLSSERAALWKPAQRQKAWLASPLIWKWGINHARRIFCYMLLSCFIWLQTFKQETLPPNTGKLILYIILDTQTYK